jgi:3-deoxy-manno-octulosonate cytidylyltransferase (CMP-KDO synthetase)
VRTIGVIPARFHSTRFEGKPLADIHGKPMVWHVYQAAMKVSEIDEVHVATEDERIASACEALGMRWVMTSRSHLTGTDRVAESARLLSGDLFVNIQGDEPMIHPEAIARVTRAMQNAKDPAIMATNAFAWMTDASDVVNTNVVKVTLTTSGRALSYSRLPIPFPKADSAVYRRQLGLYCFTRRGLELFSELSPGSVERSESVEMLRFVENDHAVLMVEVDDDSVPVDTEFDLERVRQLMAGTKP